MLYDDEIEDRRDRYPREEHAERERMRHEARTAFAKAARAMRRRATVKPFTVSPIPERIERAGVLLEPRGYLLSRAEIERMAAEVAADYCGHDTARGLR